MTELLESVIVDRAIKKLNQLQFCRAEKLHGSAWGHQRLDVLCCYKGQLFYLEGKRPGRRATPKQEATMMAWRKAGAVCEVFTSAEEAVNIVTREDK